MTDKNNKGSSDQKPAPAKPTAPINPPYIPSPIRMDTIKNGVSTGRIETKTTTSDKK